MSRAIVVGGGIAGLASALRLQQQGVDVLVLEKSDRAGGVIESSRSDGYLREQAANGFLGRGDAGAIELCEELGVELCEASPMAKKRWICLRGELHELPSNPVAFARSGLLSWRGKLAALGEPLRAPGRQDLDESVGSFARRRFGDEVAAHFVAPFVTGIFAGDADALSLKAAFPILAELDAQGGMVRGMIKRQLAARKKAGEAKNKPGSGKGGGDRMAAPREGVGALTAAVVSQLGDAVRCGAEVRSMELRQGRPHLMLADGTAHDAEVVVLATPAHATAKIVEAASAELAAAARSIPYAPVVVVHLGFDRASIQHQLDGFGFLVAAGGPVRLLGCVFESVLWPGRAPEGKVLLRCIFGGSRDPMVCELSDAELVDAACRDLGATLGLRGEPVHVNVTRWPEAISQYTIGHCERVAQAEELARPLGLVLAGSAYHGVAVNSCVSDGLRVAREVLSRLGSAAAALLLAVALVACSGSSGKQVENSGRRDGGDASAAAATPAVDRHGTPKGAAPPYTLATVGADGKLIEPGRLEVQVAWADPPARLLRSPGANACGVTRAPAVSVHTLHGLRGAVVRIEGIESGIAPAATETSLVAIRDCNAEPRVQVASRLGATVAIANEDSRRHELVLQHDRGAGALVPMARIPLPLAGQRYALALDQPGLYQIGGDSVADRAWVVVPEHPYVAITDEKGRVSFPQVPAGTYQVAAWHPPLGPGEPALRAAGEVVIEAGGLAELTLEPRPR